MNDNNPNQLAAGLAQISSVLRANQWAEGRQHGLTPTQMNVLSILGATGPERVSDLARQLNVSQPTMSDAVTALQAKKMITRAQDSSDRRASLVRLTQKGRDCAAAIDGSPDFRRAVSSLGDEDDGAMKRALVLIIRELQRSGAIVAQRDCVTCQFFKPHVHDDATRPHHCAFVDAAFGNSGLRLECSDHKAASSELSVANFKRFSDRGGG